MGIFPRIRRMGVDGLQIDEDMPESAAKAINRRKISTANNGNAGNNSEMIKRCRPGTYKARWAGFGSTSSNGGTTCMCVAAIACCGMSACVKRTDIHAGGTIPGNGTSATGDAATIKAAAAMYYVVAVPACRAGKGDSPSLGSVFPRSEFEICTSL